MRLVATESRKSKIFLSKILISDKTPCDKDDTELKAIRGSITIKQAFFLDFENFRETKSIDTSANEIVEVRAATMSKRKKRDDQNLGNGMLAKTSGKVTNTNVAPSSDSPSNPNDITAGKIIIPINIATPKSRKETVPAVFMRFVFLG